MMHPPSQEVQQVVAPSQSRCLINHHIITYEDVLTIVVEYTQVNVTATSWLVFKGFSHESDTFVLGVSNVFADTFKD